MASDIIKGEAKQVKGKAREELGKATGEKRQQIKGEAEQVAGELQEQYGKATRNIGTLVDWSERVLQQLEVHGEKGRNWSVRSLRGGAAWGSLPALDSL